MMLILVDVLPKFILYIRSIGKASELSRNVGKQERILLYHARRCSYRLRSHCGRKLSVISFLVPTTSLGIRLRR